MYRTIPDTSKPSSIPSYQSSHSSDPRLNRFQNKSSYDKDLSHSRSRSIEKSPHSFKHSSHYDHPRGSDPRQYHHSSRNDYHRPHYERSPSRSSRDYHHSYHRHDDYRDRERERSPYRSYHKHSPSTSRHQTNRPKSPSIKKSSSHKKIITIYVKMEEDDYQPKVEPKFSAMVPEEKDTADTSLEADNVSTNSSEKSSLQNTSSTKFELPDQGLLLNQERRDPRMMMEKDPRFINPDARFTNKDPRFTNKHSRITNKDPRLTNKDPRFINQDPRLANKDPRFSKKGIQSYEKHHIVKSMEADLDALFENEEEEDSVIKKEEKIHLKPARKLPNSIEIIDLEIEEEKKPEVFMIEPESDDEVVEITEDLLMIPQTPETTKKRIDPRKKIIQMNEKLNLVLDLDETIINSHTVSQDFDLKIIKNIPADHLSIMNNGEMKTIIVLRPYTRDFLKRVSRHYNIYVYSHGRYDYVQHILDFIDQNKEFINREKIFKNSGQVCRTTYKKLSNLGFTQDEINKTIILDDQRQIWEHEHLQVICSKKFIPLKDFIREEKYSKYWLFKGQEYTDKNWLSSQENQSELEFYCETHSSFSSRLGQLEVLASFFEVIAKDYEKISGTKPETKVHELCGNRMKTILKGMKIAVISNSEERKETFEEVAGMLGATLTEAEKAHYLIAGTNLEEAEKSFIKNLVEEKPMITVVSIAWLMECFFRLTKANITNYLERSI